MAENYKFDGYRIITPEARKMPTHDAHARPGLRKWRRLYPDTCGSGTTHRNNKRIGNRLMGLTLQSANSHTPITIIIAYVPKTGATKQERRKHREKTEEMVKNTPQQPYNYMER